MSNSPVFVAPDNLSVFQGDEGRPLWEPSPCHLCSDNFRLPRGTGKAQVKSKHRWTVCPECEGSGYGPQYRILAAVEDEILAGGARRGGKSDAAMVWLAKGNPDRDQRYDFNRSYFHHPKYRALVIRRDKDDLEGFLLHCENYYRAWGGKLFGSPSSRYFRFPSGAYIWTGHLKEASTYTKYIGRPELHRIVVEELTLIPEERSYLLLKSALSSSTDELRMQILSTTNPAGPGTAWVYDRFVHVTNPDGLLVPWGKTVYEKVEHPYTGKTEYNTRIFIPAKVRDNPHVSSAFVRGLMGLPEKERKAYLHGDWQALSGTFFGDLWRDPLTADYSPAEPCHVVVRRRHSDSIATAGISEGYPRLLPWWRREMGGDWGYAHESAILWAAKNPDTQQVHIYRELVVSKTGAQALGARIAQLTLDELNASPSHRTVLWFSHDAFAQRNDEQGVTSQVELIGRGIAQVLGPNAVHIPELDIARRKENWSGRLSYDEEFRRSFLEWQNRLLAQQNAGITIRRANRNRVLGWDYMREMMVMEPPISAMGSYDATVEAEIRREFGDRDADRYRATYSRAPGLYPRLQVWEVCERLRHAIPRLQHDEKNPEDVERSHHEGISDVADACRYLLASFSDADPPEPTAAKVARKIHELRQRDPDANLVFAAQMIEAQEKADAPKPYAKIGRRGDRRRGFFKQFLAGRSPRKR